VKAIRGLAIPGESEVHTSNEDLGQEGCYLRDGLVYMPDPSVLAEHGVIYANPLQKETEKASANASGVIQPICFRPLDEGPVEVDTDYSGLDLKPLVGIPSPQICNEKCKEDKLCFAWTWSSKGSAIEKPYQCFLKYYLPNTKRKSVDSIGFVSGMPNRHDPTWGLLYCFAVMSPDLEKGDYKLLKAQSEINHGLFACDEHSVYSSDAIEITPGEHTTVVDHDFKCDIGGVTYSCLNTGTFIAVWKHIFKQGNYIHYAWTVKVEPDAVFLADRLRSFLGNSFYKSVGIAYLNNCERGLHGAIEVFSRGAVQAFAVLGPVCYSGAHKLDYHTWNEALFMDQCLGKVLQVPRVEGYGLLADDRCGSSDWQECSSTSVAFHPFKDPESFRECVRTADQRGDVADEFYRRKRRRLDDTDVLV